MRTIVTTLLSGLILFAYGADAQWAAAGNNIFNTNSDFVLVHGGANPNGVSPIGVWGEGTGALEVQGFRVGEARNNAIVGVFADIETIGGINYNTALFVVNAPVAQNVGWFETRRTSSAGDALMPPISLNLGGWNALKLVPTTTSRDPVSGYISVTGLRSEFLGDVTVSGNIGAKYQDIAEWVEAEESLEAGTVVELDTTMSNRVQRSRQAYGSNVAGVVSARPGIILGDPGTGRVRVATMGRVKVKVDAGERPVRIGDLLVSAERPGFAQVSEPVEVQGVRIHRPGTLIGKALENLPSGQGEILVLLSMQ